LRQELLAWFTHHGRDLPWRRTRDPYAILVSEFMLQQTQVATVLPYYEKWLKRFPDFATLARADEAAVLHAWQGLGYYTRARNLRTVAKFVIENLYGKLPTDAAKIAQLPGVGDYTAGAVASFAFDLPVPVVEANIARVLARLTNLQIPIDSSCGRDKLWQMATALVPANGARAHNAALMDLGATICLPRRPLCELCPIRKFCCAKDPAGLPLKKPKPRPVLINESHAFTRQRDRILLEQSRVRWRGMWILPRLTTIPCGRPLLELKFPFTHHRITLSVFARAEPKSPNENQRWFPLRALSTLPFPSPHRRALAQLLLPQKSCAAVREECDS
jgi:A/G-specific adenine glycosylase